MRLTLQGNGTASLRDMQNGELFCVTATQLTMGWHYSDFDSSTIDDDAIKTFLTTSNTSYELK